MAIKPNNLSQDELNGGVEILDNLNSVGIALWLEGEGVCCSIAISEELRTTLHRHWAGLVCALRAQADAKQAIRQAAKTAIAPPNESGATRAPIRRRSRYSGAIRKPAGHSFHGGNAQ